MEQAISHFHSINNISSTHTNNTSNFFFNFPILNLDSFFLNDIIITQLNNYRIRLSLETYLEFYTDGSHHFSAPSTSYLSSAFVLVHSHLDISFAAALPPIWANSSNAEIFALLIVLFIAPYSSSLKVFTDSLVMIQTFNHIFSTRLYNYPSLLFKTPFYIYWCFIFKLIEQRNLNVTLVKVKAHSNDPYNDKVDQLAKSTLYSPPLQLNFSYIPYISHIPMFHHLPINTSIRPFFKNFTNAQHFADFFNLNRNNKYRSSSINWLITFNIIKSTSPLITNSKDSITRKYRYYLLLEQTPTIELLKRTRPDLYGPAWKCCRCNFSNETFSHLWTCISVTPILNSIIRDTIQTLKNQIYIHTSRTNWSDELKLLLDPTNNFWSTDDTNNSLTFIDLIKGIVPSKLYRTINDFADCNKTYMILSSVYDFIFTQTFELIWKPRCELMIAKELSLNITTKRKRIKKNSSSVSLSHSASTLHSPNDTHLDPIELSFKSLTHGRSVPLFFTQ